MFLAEHFVCIPPSCSYPQISPESRGLIRAVNSYAGFTEFDKSPAFLHPDSCEPTLMNLSQHSHCQQMLDMICQASNL